MVFPGPALAEIIQDLIGHILGLVVLVHGGVDLELLPLPCLSPQLFAFTALVVADNRIGGLQNVLSGAVVLLQANGAAAGILFFKGEDVLNGGSPEAVDGLVIIAHHAEVLIAPRQGGGQQILQIIGILVLVNENVAEFPPVIGAHLFKLLKQPHRVQDDIVKVQGVGLPQPVLVAGIHLGDFIQAVVSCLFALGGVVLCQQHLILGPGDVAQDRPGRELFVVQLQFLKAVLDDPQRVVGVVDGKGGGKAQPLNIPAQDAHAGRVEGGGPDVLRLGAQHGGQAVLQFPGSFIGKGNGQNRPGSRRVQGTQGDHSVPVPLSGFGVGLQEVQVFRRDPFGHFRTVRTPPVAHQVGNAVNQYRGLSAARSCQQQQRSLRGQYRLLLFRVKAGKVPGNGRAARGSKTLFLLMIQHGDPSCLYKIIRVLHCTENPSPGQPCAVLWFPRIFLVWFVLPGHILPLKALILQDINLYLASTLSSTLDKPIFCN